MIQIKQVAGALGALISGVDLRDDLGAERVAQIRQALLDHQVIFFRDQTLTPAQYLRFARLMGEPFLYH